VPQDQRSTISVRSRALVVERDLKQSKTDAQQWLGE
jgi:hypothetical protein